MGLSERTMDGSPSPGREAAPLIAQQWLDRFAAALTASDRDAVAALFMPDVYWRDILAFTWDIRTFSGKGDASLGMIGFAGDRRPGKFALDPSSLKSLDRGTVGPSIEAQFSFETDIGWGQGHVRLRELATGSGEWAAWTVFTALKDLKGHEEKVGNNRPNFVETSMDPARKWMTADEHAAHYETHDPDTVIIGGAQTGLALAARLGRLRAPMEPGGPWPRIREPAISSDSIRRRGTGPLAYWQRHGVAHKCRRRIAPVLPKPAGCA